MRRRTAREKLRVMSTITVVKVVTTTKDMVVEMVAETVAEAEDQGTRP